MITTMKPCILRHVSESTEAGDLRVRRAMVAISEQAVGLEYPDPAFAARLFPHDTDSAARGMALHDSGCALEALTAAELLGATAPFLKQPYSGPRTGKAVTEVTQLGPWREMGPNTPLPRMGDLILVGMNPPLRPRGGTVADTMAWQAKYNRIAAEWGLYEHITMPKGDLVEGVTIATIDGGQVNARGLPSIEQRTGTLELRWGHWWFRGRRIRGYLSIVEMPREEPAMVPDDFNETIDLTEGET